MKVHLTTLLLAIVMVASSICQAADTLVITSHRIVNTCSGDKTWLISAGIGEVYFADSLMSIDISLQFDTTKLRPSAGLSSGTLSAQMKDLGGPFFTLNRNGEMRVSAFTINTPVKGKLPLFAFTGDYIGTCNSHDSLKAPLFAVELNPESRRKIVAVRSELISSIASTQRSIIFGSQFDSNHVVVENGNIPVAIPLNVQTIANGGILTVEVKVQDSLFAIDSVVAKESGSIVVDSIAPGIRSITLSSVKNDTIPFYVYIRPETTTTEEQRTTLYTTATATSECECYSPALHDSVSITVLAKTTGIDSETEIQQRSATMQDILGKAGNLTIYDLLGKSSNSIDVSEGWTQAEVLMDLESMPYLIRFVSPQGVQRIVPVMK